MKPTRVDLLRYIAAILDDAGGVVDRKDTAVSFDLQDVGDCVLIGYETGFEPTVWAVRSAIGVVLEPDEAEEIVQEYLRETGWFGDGPRAADHVLTPED